jgi:hypothetical protein
LAAATVHQLATTPRSSPRSWLESFVQGAAGLLVHPRGFLARSVGLRRRRAGHLIIDEVAGVASPPYAVRRRS